MKAAIYKKSMATKLIFFSLSSVNEFTSEFLMLVYADFVVSEFRSSTNYAVYFFVCRLLPSMWYAIHIHDIPLNSMFLQAHAQSYRLDHRRNNNKKSTRTTTANSSVKMNWVLFKVCVKFESKCTFFKENETMKKKCITWIECQRCVFYSHLLLARNHQRQLQIWVVLFFFLRAITLFHPKHKVRLDVIRF